MTHQDFTNFQKALGLSGRELAEKLSTDPASISRWKSGEREIPDYIAKLMVSLMQEVEISLPLNVLIDLGKVAESRGLTIGQLIIASLKDAAQAAEPPKPYLLDATAEADQPAPRAADDEPPVTSPAPRSPAAPPESSPVT